MTYREKHQVTSPRWTAWDIWYWKKDHWEY